MAGPISGYTPGSCQAYQNHTPNHPHPAPLTGSSQYTRTHPGSGIAYVHGRPVEMKAMNQTGFVSAFSTHRTSAIASRRHLAINPRHAIRILNQQERLAQEAHNTMVAISRLDLNSHPALNETLKQLSRAHMSAVPASQRWDMLESITDYQAPQGDNYLMNISVMGYQSLQHFLQSLSHEYTDAKKVEEFILDFADRYEAMTGMEEEEEELDELRNRLESRLMEPAARLQHFLSTGPRISNIPLLKGATGGDVLVTTQLNGAEVMKAVLNGQALNFNTFLSTTTGVLTALDFCGRNAEAALGQPHYVVDLTKDTEEAEVLRRDALRNIENGEMDTNSILFYFKTQNAIGVNLAAAQEVVNPANNNYMNDEDEVLLTPGHYFQPEQIIRNENGVALIGTLTNGNLV